VKRLRLLFVGAIAVGLLVVGIFWWRAHQTGATDARLCRKVDRLGSALFVFVSSQKPPKPGDYGYAYWRTHHRSEPVGAPGGKPPPALLALLRSAACDPANLPSTGGKP
jgi:hypothetical protein